MSSTTKPLQPMTNFYMMVAGKGMSDFGNFLNMIAFNLYVYILTGSALYLGFFMAIRLFGGFICGFLSGFLADKWNRKSLMIFSDFVRGLALLALVLTPQEWHIPLLALTSFILGGLGQVFNVALQASIPAIVGQERVIKANAVITALQSISMVGGTLTAGVLLGFVSYAFVFSLNALLFILSGFILILLSIETRERTSLDSSTEKKEGFLSQVTQIFQYVRLLPIMMTFLFIRLVDTFGSASHNVGMPVFAAQLDPQNPSIYLGSIWACWAVGNVLGASGSMKKLKNNSAKTSEYAFGYATFFMSLFFIFVFFWEHWYLILPIAVLAGIADGVSAICFNSRLQSEPDHIRGRIFGVASSIQTFGFGIGMIICSPLLEITTPFIVAGIMHGIPLIMCIWFIVFLGRYYKKTSQKMEQHF
ncbi:MFS transporter [Caldalkalibacillus mannanilyticus]|uniref:MFS transporter n=1 Tax=Caldalkalibacillus mannanilyticus TaxID=1418 RepID=UPI00046A3C7E|nr:MFS transporter [Caldalkalibacillus mannanilyticus]